MKRKVINKWIECWNASNIDGCELLLDDSVKLISTHVLRLFPDSNGVIIGKETALKYFHLIFEKYPAIKIGINSLRTSDDSVILDSLNEDNITCHVQYYVNDSNLIYLVKADISEV